MEYKPTKTELETVVDRIFGTKVTWLSLFNKISVYQTTLRPALNEITPFDVFLSVKSMVYINL